MSETNPSLGSVEAPEKPVTHATPGDIVSNPSGRRPARTHPRDIASEALGSSLAIKRVRERSIKDQEDQLVDGSPPIDFNDEVENDTRADDSLTVSEIFGPTWQGEGPTLGRLCTFIRLGACNLTCGADGGWKCDANYTWDWTGITGTKFDPKVELHKMTSAQIIEEVKRHAPKTWDNPAYTGPLSKGFVVISGGEPLLQQAKMGQLLSKLRRMNWRIEIETNGTKIPDELVYASVDQFNVSPKLSNSGNTEAKRKNLRALKFFASRDKAVFKFVVSQESDLKEINNLMWEAVIPPHKIYLMPEGVSVAEINKHTELVAEAALKHGFNLTTRLQVIVYGNRRGV